MHDHFLLNEKLWLITQPVGVAVYDFDFRQYFDCRTPYQPPEGLPGLARIGAFQDYTTFYQECQQHGIQLVHTPEQQLLCTTLPLWYPLIESDTPRSKWYDSPPSYEEISADFTLPIFIKGERQTSKHKAAASIVRNKEEYEAAVEIYKADPILRWQRFVCRVLHSLRPVPGGVEGKIPASYEFRTFWWRGQLVGAGAYWYDASPYHWTPAEQQEALTVAKRAVEALGTTFLVIDLAQTTEGRWIIIECNDGMESGYAAASPFTIWQNILEIESRI